MLDAEEAASVLKRVQDSQGTVILTLFADKSLMHNFSDKARFYAVSEHDGILPKSQSEARQRAIDIVIQEEAAEIVAKTFSKLL